MARRSGLSGGDLKAMFLAGAAAGGTDRTDRRAAGFENTVEQLQASLHAAERKLRGVAQQQAELRRQADRARARLRLERAVAAATLLLLGGVAAALLGMASGGRALRSAIPAGSPLAHMARVGSAGATVYASEDIHSPVIAQLSPGTPFPVRSLEWHSLNQWALSSIGPVPGYVSASELQLP